METIALVEVYPRVEVYTSCKRETEAEFVMFVVPRKKSETKQLFE